MLITAPRFARGGRLEGPGWIDIDGDRINAIGSGDPPGPPDRVLDSGVLAPGAIDLQLNGAFGIDVAAASPDDLDLIATGLPSTGVTRFVPTLTTAPLDALTEALRVYRGWADDTSRHEAARPLGMHLEGPFLSPEQAGAHPVAALRLPEPAAIDALLDAAAGHLTYITLAPELPGALRAVRRLLAEGIAVSVGHSDASDTQTIEAFDAGASLVTHLYNAQRGLHHRDPGVVGAALSDPRPTLGLIADGIHLAATAARVAFAAASGRVALVTDATSAMGMPPGRYLLGDEEVHVDGPAPLRRDGTLAGSTLTMDRALRWCLEIGIEPGVAVDAATRVPADALGRDDLGRLEAGAIADLVWFDDDWTVSATWVDGALAYETTTPAGSEAP